MSVVGQFRREFLFKKWGQCNAVKPPSNLSLTKSLFLAIKSLTC